MAIRMRLLVATVLACVPLVAWGAPAQAAESAETMPPITGLHSLSNPSPNAWYPSHDVTVSWTPLAGIFGYRMGLDDDPTGTAFAAGGMPPESYTGFGPSFSLDAVLDIGPLGGPVTGDFNGDGNLDVAGVASSSSVGFFRGAAGAVVVALGNGNGSFGDLTSYPLSDMSPRSVTVADFDEDGTPDLAVGAGAIGLFEGDRGRLVIMRGLGDGTFVKTLTYSRRGADGEMAADDFDRDGHVDLAWTDFWDGAVSVSTGAGDGTFGAPTDYATDDIYMRGLVSGDLNGDGRPDLAVVLQDRQKVGVFLGSDSGFAARVEYGTGGDNPYAVAAADLDGDGHLDLAVVNDSVPYGVGVLTGAGDGTFAPAVMTGCGYSPQEIVAGHFRDGKAYLAVTSPLSFSLDLLSGYGPGGLSSDVQYGAYGWSPASADFDGDGGSDLVVDGGTVLMSTSTHELRHASPYATGERPAAVVAADLTGDGHPDVVTADHGSDTVSVLLCGGDATLKARSSYATGHGPVAVSLADLDGDGARDVVTADGGADTVSVLLGAGDGTLAKAVPFAAGARPHAVAVADLNGDGDLDVVVSDSGDPFDYTSLGVSVLLGNGDGTLQAAVRYEHMMGVASLAIADVDRDGHLDVVCGMGGGGGLALLPGNGDGTLQAATYRNTYSGGDVLVVTDFNGDGLGDIVITGAGQTLASVLLGTPTGLLLYGYPFYTTGAVQAMAAADFDGDGRMDLAVAQGATDASEPSANTVALLHNTLTDPVEQYTGISDGIWYVHAQTVATDGSRGPIATLSVKVDSTPPRTLADAVQSWVGAGDVATFAATDPPPAVTGSATAAGGSRVAAPARGSVQTSGVAKIQYSLDDGATWKDSTAVTVAAVRAGDGDGEHQVSYRSIDNAGNVEDARSFTARVDTTRPTPQLRRVTVKSGRSAKVPFTVVDPAPCAGTATVAIIVKSGKGRVLARMPKLKVTTGVWLAERFKCRLKAGTYRIEASAVDAAGNAQSRLARATLVVH